MGGWTRCCTPCTAPASRRRSGRPLVPTLNGLPNLLGAFAGKNGGPPAAIGHFLEPIVDRYSVCDRDLDEACRAGLQTNAPKRSVVRANDPDIMVARSEIHPHPGLIDQ